VLANAKRIEFFGLSAFTDRSRVHGEATRRKRRRDHRVPQSDYAVCRVAVIAETLENTDVYTPTTSWLAALVIIDILSTSVALRKGDQHTRDVLHMKKRLAKICSSGVI
jgi:hypothetical protein